MPARSSVDIDTKDSSVELPGVSVIIPVKNAGATFDGLLQAYENQKFIPKVKLIVVDSGSSDGTPEVALRHGATLLTIPPGTFSHSTARNRGAALATEELILFTVQDAFPPGDDWLSILVRSLLLNDVAAVSCIETPPPEADLFARFTSSNHYRNLGLNRQDCILSMPKSRQFMALWQNAQLSNIACLIRRQEFSQYQFQGDYAEDLRLGLDLIRNGYRLAFLSSVAIRHAHDRPPFYFLRRGFVDYVTMAGIFEDFPRLIPSLETLLPQIRHVEGVLSSLFQMSLFENGTSCSTPVFCRRVIRKINQLRKSRREEPPPEIQDLGQETACFMDWLDQDRTRPDNRNQPMMFLDAALGLWIQILNFRMETRGIMDRNQKLDVRQSLVKAFAVQLGAFLGACYRFDTQMEPKRRDEMMARLNHDI